MFKFLFVMFFFFILLVFLMGFSILRTFKNILFGSSNSRKGEQRQQTTNKKYSDRQSQSESREEDYASSNRKKIFAKDEGEYVDFEEVK